MVTEFTEDGSAPRLAASSYSYVLSIPELGWAVLQTVPAASLFDLEKSLVQSTGLLAVFGALFYAGKKVQSKRNKLSQSEDRHDATLEGNVHFFFFM